MKLQHVNHASVIIDGGPGAIFLTDPWYLSPAFGGWTQYPSPPAHLVENIVRMPVNEWNVVISHGHDDHLDEFFIRNHLRDARFYVPKFQTSGLASRIERLTGRHPREVDQEGCAVGDATVHTFVNSAYAPYDAVVVVKTSKHAVIHANDNWRLYPDLLTAQISACLSGIPQENVYFLVQFGIADCFPLNYPGIDSTVEAALITQRFNAYLTETTANASALGILAERRFYYANQSKYSYPRRYDGPALYDLAQQFLGNSETSFRQCIPGAQLGKGEALPSGVGLFRHCLRRLEELVNRELKGESPLSLITESEEPDVDSICYQASEAVWQRILVGELTLEALTIGGLGLVHKKADLNMARTHHQISKLAYGVQARISANGLHFYFGS